MKYIGVVRYKNQPVERRTNPSDDLRVVIGQTLNLVQSAVFECAAVEACVWEESGRPGAAPMVKVLPISMDATKLPSLLLRPAEKGQAALPALGGTGAAAPASQACAYCSGVAELVEDYGPGISWRYRCGRKDCGFEQSYSPAQATAWRQLHPVRSDGRRVDMPPAPGYGTPPKALATYVDNGKLLLLTGGDSARLQIYSAAGKEHGRVNCRVPRDEEMGLGLAKTYLADKEAVEYLHAGLAAAEPLPLFATPPPTKESTADLAELLRQAGNRHGNRKLQLVTGKWVEVNWQTELASDGVTLALSRKEATTIDQVARLTERGGWDEYGENPPTLLLWQLPGWVEPVKPAKGKKASKASETAAGDDQDDEEPDTDEE